MLLGLAIFLPVNSVPVLLGQEPNKVEKVTLKDGKVVVQSSLMVLAFQTDVTRIVTFMVAREGSDQKYPMVGVTEGHHTILHHQNRASNLARLKAIGDGTGPLEGLS